jgi:hypothetical protein
MPHYLNLWLHTAWEAVPQLLAVLLIAGSAVILPDPVIEEFNKWVRRKSDFKKRTGKVRPYVPTRILGGFERLLAFGIYLFSIPNGGAMLAGWIAAKLAANWQRRAGQGDDETGRLVRMNTFVALMGGTVSVAIGAAAGTLARYYWLGCCTSS